MAKENVWKDAIEEAVKQACVSVSYEDIAEQAVLNSLFFIYGTASVAKARLWEEICSTTGPQGRGKTSIDVTAKQFTNQFLEALRASAMPVFRSKYRDADLLIVDDLQDLVGKRATQIELLYTVDSLLGNGRLVVLAADQPPAELRGLAPELIARMSSGKVYRINQP